MRKFILLYYLVFVLLSGWSINAVAQCSSCQVHITPGAIDTICNTQKLSWAKWNSVTATAASGTVSSSINITCTQTQGGMFTTGGMFAGGNFPPQYNVPISTTAIANSNAGVFTFCFNKPVVNPQIALASIGNGGTTVNIVTSVPYCVIWQGISMTYINDTTFSGREGYTIIRFPGVHTCISFNYLQSEHYWNLAFGVQDTSCQVVPPVLCNGGQVTLNATGGSSFTWSPAAGLDKDTGASVIATPSVTTRYYVTDGSCTDSVLVTVGSVAVATEDTAICYGYSLQLEARGGNKYKWLPTSGLDDPNKADPVAQPLTSTSYTVNVSPALCNDSIAVVDITVYPTPPTPLIDQRNDTLFCGYDSVYASFQWYFEDQPIPGATDTFYVSPKDGNFNVAVTDTNGCMISVGINIVLGRPDVPPGREFIIKPNPAGRDISIRAPYAIEKLYICDMTGRPALLFGFQLFEKNALVDISVLPPGVYFITLQSGGRTSVKRFIKQ